VFLSAVLAASTWTSGCVGISSPAATTNPVPQPDSAMLTVSPSSVSVAAVVGNTGSQTVTATNVGNSSVAIKQVTVTGAGFSTTGLAVPASVAPGASQSFQVAFAATTPGTATGSMSIMTNAGSSPVVVVQLSATATAAPSAPAPPPTPPTPPPTVTSVTISPASASISTKGTISFTATVQGATTNPSVTWTASSGTISSAGLYTAPAAAGSATITATSVADTTKSASATVTITGAPVANPVVSSVTVSPASASVSTSGTAQFAATVQGTVTNKSVTWKASAGTISSAGLYTAPATAGSATVTATSVADTTKSASASISISAPASAPPPVVNSVRVTPSSATVTTDGTLQFSATVQGTVTNTSVTWVAQRGTISAAGAYVAPSGAGNDTVTATSVADTTKSGTATITVSVPVASGALPAFPGAEGGGAASVGGRGGQVFEVTNLNDSGEGSLRACTFATGPRTCVFRVAGIITPSERFTIASPYLTVACQTAPGEVIIGGPKIANESFYIATHDVTVRYCTFSADNINIPAGPDTGTVNVEIANGNNYNIILDHITTRWAGNKLWITLSNYIGPNRLITTQWSMFYEPHVNHPVGPGTSTNTGCTASAGSPCFSFGEHDIDFHHNLFADMSHRIPESTNYSTRWVNNIVFNWNFYASEWLGAMTVDEIGNKYVAGNLNRGSQKHEIHFTTLSPPLPGDPSTYLSGNIGPNQSDPSGNQYAMAAEIDGENGDEIGAVPSSWIRSSPMPAPAFPINPDPVGNLDSVLLPTVGNSQHLDCNGNWVSHRDAADQRIINQYQSGGPGGFWPNGLTAAVDSLPKPGSAWTDQPLTNFSACTESLHDGIPDQWKAAQGLSTTDPSLYNEIAPNGYTYLENYVNGPQ
jgi:hypothetical protein